MMKYICEESSVYRNGKVKKILSVAFKINGIILSILSAFAFVAFLFVPKENFVFALIIFFVLFGLSLSAFFFSDRSIVSFDYSISETDLRIAKVYNGKRRRIVAALKLFENISKIELYERKEIDTKKRFFTENKTVASYNKNLVLLKTKSEGDIVIDCSTEFLNEIIGLVHNCEIDREVEAVVSMLKKSSRDL